MRQFFAGKFYKIKSVIDGEFFSFLKYLLSIGRLIFINSIILNEKKNCDRSFFNNLKSNSYLLIVTLNRNLNEKDERFQVFESKNQTMSNDIKTKKAIKILTFALGWRDFEKTFMNA